MRLIRLRVRHFRGIDDVDVRFGDVTLVTGRNESGKSSLIDAFDYLISTKASSARADIKAAQPVGRDVGPEVEAEFEIGDHRLTYAKQWIKNKQTRLTFTGGPLKGQSFTGDEAHDRVEQLWAQLDTDLWAASRVMASESFTQHNLTASDTLRRALEGQSGTSVDDASVPILERAEAEMRLFYTKSGKATGQLAAAQDAHDERQAALVAARADLDDLEGLITTLSDLERDVETRQASLARERQSREELADRAGKARDSKDALDRATDGEKVARREAEYATKRLEERTALLAELTGAEQDLTGRREQLSSIDFSDLTTRIEDVKAERATAREHLEESRQARAAGAQVLASKALAAEASRITGILAKVAAIDEDEAGLPEATIDPTVIAKLDQLELSLATTRAVRDSVATRLKLTALGSSPIQFNGENVEDIDVALTATSTIHIPGIVDITLTPPDDSSVADIESDLAELLRHAGLETVEALRETFAREKEAALERQRLAERRADLLGDDSVGSLKDRLEEIGDVEDVDDDIDVASLDAAEAAAQQTFDAASARLEALTDELAKVRERHATLTGSIDAQAGLVDRLTRAVAEARDEISDEDLKARADEAQANKATAEQATASARAAFEESGGLSLLDDLEVLTTRVASLEEMVRQSETEQAKAIAILESKNRDDIQELHDRLVSEVDQSARTLASLESRAQAARYLYDVLRSHQDALHAKYVEPFRAELEKLARIAFDDRDLGVVVSSDLTVTGLERDGLIIPTDTLSVGAEEQLAILIRLATASLVGAGGVPLMFDDVLGHSDAGRLIKMTSVLNRHVGGQLMIFTANDERFSGLQGVTRVDLSRR